LVKIILLFESICSRCSSKAKFCCSLCGRPFCGRCLSKEKKDLLSNIIVPAGLCRNCVEERLQENNEGVLNHLSEAVTVYVTDPIENKKIVDNS